MIFVPNVPVPASQRLSPRARDLSDQMSKTIEEFRRYYPDTTESDIRTALEAAGEGLSGGSRRRVVAVAAGVLAAGLAVLLATSSGGGLPPLAPGAWIGITGMVAAVLIVIIRRVRQ